MASNEKGRTGGRSRSSNQRQSGGRKRGSNQGRSSGSNQGRSSRSNRASGDGGVSPAEVARAARGQLAELTGRPAESVLGLRREDNGWKVMVEIVELSRVPNSTDLLGCYVVTLDEDGDLTGYERVRRYQRSQAGGDEQ